jgi:hypothetical protein
VLAAILVAFGLDTWWDDRAAAVRTEELLQVISGEFETAVIQLDSLVELNERAGTLRSGSEHCVIPLSGGRLDDRHRCLRVH